ncbi:MAG: dihydropteroate synthase-like protein [Candidatus Methylarchaceae archaeon HK02M2]|nr:dihydropteroate synthase-like protein [Candidatus Methylarchaceae archaeon HK02M2]
MRVLLITGQLAKKMVKKYASESNVEFEIMDLSTSVAALLKPQFILQELKIRKVKDFDVVIIPGLISGNVSLIDEIGIPTFKGPRYAADIPLVLDLLGKVKLSKTLPADKLLKEELKRRALEEIETINRYKDELLKRPWNKLIRDLPIGKDFPVKIMAEIVDAPQLTDKEIIKKAKYYVKSGADIIDVGMISGECRPDDAKRAVKAIRSTADSLISIDTMDPKEAEAAISAGADLILSVDGSNIEEMASFASSSTIVVIPTNYDKQQFPEEPFEKVNLIEENIRKARKLGMNNIIADLILNPIISLGVVNSLVAFNEFKRRNPDVPLLMGVGNVTELLDADTIGVNALLTGIASELGVSILLTTEVSDKTRGSVNELSVASRLMFLSKKRSSVPKDLGLDLLVMKEKKLMEEPYDRRIEGNVEVIKSKNDRERKMDPKGCFKILLDRDENEIVTMFYPSYDLNGCSLIVKGKKAEEIYHTLIELNLVSLYDHAAYIGSELQKAQIALKTGKNYLQDAPIFSEL